MLSLAPVFSIFCYCSYTQFASEPYPQIVPSKRTTASSSRRASISAGRRTPVREQGKRKCDKVLRSLFSVLLHQREVNKARCKLDKAREHFRWETYAREREKHSATQYNVANSLFY